MSAFCHYARIAEIINREGGKIYFGSCSQRRHPMTVRSLGCCRGTAHGGVGVWKRKYTERKQRQKRGATSSCPLRGCAPHDNCPHTRSHLLNVLPHSSSVPGWWDSPQTLSSRGHSTSRHNQYKTKSFAKSDGCGVKVSRLRKKMKI